MTPKYPPTTTPSWNGPPSLANNPPAEFEAGGEANGRALAYLAHELLGDAFGTVYDVGSILMLWFAGASATGILAIMASAAFAVTVSARRRRRPRAVLGFGVVTMVVAYALVANIIDKPDGIVISLAFIVGVVVISLVSRLSRTTELRVDDIEFDDPAEQCIRGSAEHGELHIVANKRQAGDLAEYRDKEREQRHLNPIPPRAPVVFLEIEVTDPPEFSRVLHVRGHRRRRVSGPPHTEPGAVPHTLAAIMLRIRDETGLRPYLHFQ